MFQEMIQNILVYVVMVTVLKGLISNKGFLEMFRFVSGMILILLFVSPLLSVLFSESDWYGRLEKNILRGDREQMEEQLQISDGYFEETLMRECEKQMEEQIRSLAQQEGLTAGRVEVRLECDGRGEVRAASVETELREGEEREAEQTSAEGGTVIPVEDIVIDGGGDGGAAGKYADRDTGRMRRAICREFHLSREVVQVWKNSGKKS